jgi:UPF0755 protein
MAQRQPLRPEIRRRRIVALVLFALVVCAVAVVAVLAVRGGGGGGGGGHPTPAAAPAPTRPFRIVFPEGFTRAQMALRVRDVARIAEHERHHRVALAAAAYLRASAAARIPCFGRRYRDLEGFLFPATYDFLTQTTSAALVTDQIEAFCDRFEGVSLAYARSKDLTRYASMIEREAAVPAERRLIAAVIYNRLRDRMQLGIDATLRYGLHIPPTASITEAELQSSSPYNTRRFYGLPPTPISNPGLASIEAAAHPAAVDYLYYVRIPGTDRHFFTASANAFDEFLATHGYK